MTKTNINSSPVNLEELSVFLGIIAEPNRLRILNLLQDGSLAVNQIQEKLELPLNLTSFHLRPLKKFGLITSQKQGLKVIYSLVETRVCSFRTLLNTFLCQRCQLQGHDVVC